MAGKRKQKGITAALQPLEQIGSAETHKPFSGPRKVGDNKVFFFSRFYRGFGIDIITKPVSRQVKAVNGIYNCV